MDHTTTSTAAALGAGIRFKTGDGTSGSSTKSGYIFMQGAANTDIKYIAPRAHAFYVDGHDDDITGTTYNDYGTLSLVLNENGSANFKGDLTVEGGQIYINDTNTKLEEGTGNSFRVTTNSGYIDIGPKNTGHCHIETDRSNFYFNKQLQVNTGIISSYDENLQLRRAVSDAGSLTLAIGEFYSKSINDSQLQLGGFTINTALEDTYHCYIPGISPNEFAGATRRLTVAATKNGTAISNTTMANAFLAHEETTSISVANTDTVIIEISGWSLNYGQWYGITFGSAPWRAKDIDIEISSDNGANYTSIYSENDQPRATVRTYHGGDGTSINKIRYTLTNWNTTSTRINHIFGYKYLEGDTNYLDKFRDESIYGAMNWKDNYPATFGNSGDLVIKHTGSDSVIETHASISTGDLYIKSQGSGHDLYLQAADDIFIRPQGGENGIKVIGNGAVELYYDNGLKLSTASDGIDVSGNVSMTTGHSTGKFAVLSASVHASYDFYNNGTTYLNGNTYIDADTTITGNSSSNSAGNAFVVNAGSTSGNSFQALRIENSGEVVTQGNYFYAAASGVSMYVQNTAVFRGAILNDSSSGHVRIADDLRVEGYIENQQFRIPNTAGSSGQVLKWPSSGTTLEWATPGGVEDQVIHSYSMSGTPEERYIIFQPTFISGSGASDYYNFDLYGYQDIGEMASQIHYKFFVHNRGVGSGQNDMNVRIQGNVAGGEFFDFFIVGTGSSSSPRRLVIHIKEDYSGVKIIPQPSEKAPTSSMFTNAASNPDTTNSTEIFPQFSVNDDADILLYPQGTLSLVGNRKYDSSLVIGVNDNPGSDYGMTNYLTLNPSDQQVEVKKKLELSTVLNPNTDTDKFLVIDSNGLVGFRTGAQVISDGGGLTGYSETDTLATVTGRGATTSTAVTLSSTGNHLSGHIYFDPYDNDGNHYPHFTDGSNQNGADVHWRLFDGSSIGVTHYWNLTKTEFRNQIHSTVDVRAPIYYDRNDTTYYLNPAQTGTSINVKGGINVNQNGLMIQAVNGYGNPGLYSYYGTLYSSNAFYAGSPSGTAYDMWCDDLNSNKVIDRGSTSHYFEGGNTGDSIRVAGDVVAFYSSDKRLKENIKPIENSLEKVKSINGVTFEWNKKSHKPTGKKDVGVIAQEVEEILPEVVETRINGYKAVDYQKLTALLIESVKELSAKVEALESKKCTCNCNCSCACKK